MEKVVFVDRWSLIAVWIYIDNGLSEFIIVVFGDRFCKGGSIYKYVLQNFGDFKISQVINIFSNILSSNIIHPWIYETIFICNRAPYCMSLYSVVNRISKNNCFHNSKYPHIQWIYNINLWCGFVFNRKLCFHRYQGIIPRRQIYQGTRKDQFK